MPESELQTAASDGRSNKKDSGEREMLMRAFSAAIALLSFALVCVKGVLEGNSFTSVVQHSLVAMVVGAVGGYLAAVAIQYVVKQEFDHQYRKPAAEESTAAPVQPSAASANGRASPEPGGRARNAAPSKEMASGK